MANWTASPLPSTFPARLFHRPAPSMALFKAPIPPTARKESWTPPWVRTWGFLQRIARAARERAEGRS